MASFTLTAVEKFPNGTTVKVYPSSGWVVPPASGVSPPVSSVAEGTMTNGSVTFTGLTKGTSYQAGAEVGGKFRYVKFLAGLDVAAVNNVAHKEEVTELEQRRVDAMTLTIPNDKDGRDGLAMPFAREVAASSVTLTSASMYWVGDLLIPAGSTVEAVSFCSNAKASTPTHAWAALALPDESGAEEAAILATSKDFLETAWEANEERLFSFKTADSGSGSWVAAEDTTVMVGLVQVAGTPATIRSLASGSGQINGMGKGFPAASLGPTGLSTPGGLANVVALGATAAATWCLVSGQRP